MSEDRPLFRQEALEHHARGHHRAEVLEIDPTATAWGYRVILLGLLSLVAFAWLGRVTEYATGPAVVQLDGRTMVTADHGALVSRVVVMPGDLVKKGDVLVEFHAAAEEAEYAAAEAEFNNQLRKLMQVPDDLAAREALVSLRARRDLAKTRLSRQGLHAPRTGIVGDVRVHEGQVVEPGMSVIEIADEASSGRVTALLPGRYRPYLAPGKRVRFELDGFSRQAQALTITNVSEQVVGPTEAARYLGRDVADVFALQGPVVLVEAELPRTSFSDGARTLAYAHGMAGKAESPVKRERVAYVFIPALKQWLESSPLTRWLSAAPQIFAPATWGELGQRAVTPLWALRRRVLSAFGGEE